MNIAVVAGGYSHEYIVSMESVKTILAHLNPEFYTTFQINIEEDQWYHPHGEENVPVNKEDFSIVLDGEKVTFDFAYIIVHGTPGEDGKLQAYFELINLPFSGCSQLASTLTFNKWACNTLLRQMNIPVAQNILLRKNDPVDPESIADCLGLPCFVKPNDGGSSFGVSKVKKTEELAGAIESAFAHGKEVLIEAFMQGTEVTCGTYFDGSDIVVLPATEIVSQNEFFDFEAKYQGQSQEITPARIPERVYQQIKENNRLIYQRMGLNGIVRIDYMIQDEVPFVIEINTTPGMSPASIIPQQAKNAGVNLTELLDQVIATSLHN